MVVRQEGPAIFLTNKYHGAGTVLLYLEAKPTVCMAFEWPLPLPDDFIIIIICRHGSADTFDVRRTFVGHVGKSTTKGLQAMSMRVAVSDPVSRPGASTPDSTLNRIQQMQTMYLQFTKAGRLLGLIHAARRRLSCPTAKRTYPKS